MIEDQCVTKLLKTRFVTDSMQILNWVANFAYFMLDLKNVRKCVSISRVILSVGASWLRNITQSNANFHYRALSFVRHILWLERSIQFSWKEMTYPSYGIRSIIIIIGDHDYIPLVVFVRLGQITRNKITGTHRNDMQFKWISSKRYLFR